MQKRPGDEKEKRSSLRVTTFLMKGKNINDVMSSLPIKARQTTYPVKLIGVLEPACEFGTDAL